MTSLTLFRIVFSLPPQQSLERWSVCFGWQHDSIVVDDVVEDRSVAHTFLAITRHASLPFRICDVLCATSAWTRDFQCRRGDEVLVPLHLPC